MLRKHDNVEEESNMMMITVMFLFLRSPLVTTRIPCRHHSNTVETVRAPMLRYVSLLAIP